MKKLFFLGFLFSCYFSSLAQDTIKALAFPYKLNYQMQLKGNVVKYDEYNFPSKKIDIHIKYKFLTETTKANKTTNQLQYTHCTENDSTVANNTYLTIQPQGMFVSIKDKDAQQHDRRDHHAIKTPLYKGLTWKVYLDDEKGTATCIQTDTLIKTIYGNVKAFGITTHALFKKLGTKDYDYYVNFTEYYNQQLGKVYVHNENYIIKKQDNKKQIVFIENYTLSNTNLTEEAIKQIPTVDN